MLRNQGRHQDTEKNSNYKLKFINLKVCFVSHSNKLINEYSILIFC